MWEQEDRLGSERLLLRFRCSRCPVCLPDCFRHHRKHLAPVTWNKLCHTDRVPLHRFPRWPNRCALPTRTRSLPWGASGCQTHSFVQGHLRQRIGGSVGALPVPLGRSFPSRSAKRSSGDHSRFVRCPAKLRLSGIGDSITRSVTDR